MEVIRVIAVGLENSVKFGDEALTQCVKFCVSLKGSPQWLASQAVPKLFQNPMFLKPQGLLRARSRFPEPVENKENADEGMERLDGAVELAKQMLSQLSYTPTAGVPKTAYRGTYGCCNWDNGTNLPTVSLRN